MQQFNLYKRNTEHISALLRYSFGRGRYLYVSPRALVDPFFKLSRLTFTYLFNKVIFLSGQYSLSFKMSRMKLNTVRISLFN